LQGLGSSAEAVVLRGEQEGKPVIFVRGREGSITVMIANLTVQDAAPLKERSPAAPCYDLLTCPIGIQIGPLFRPSEKLPPEPQQQLSPLGQGQGPLRVYLRNVKVQNNATGGLFAGGKAQVFVDYSTLAENSPLAWADLWVQDQAILTVNASRIGTLIATGGASTAVEGSELASARLLGSAQATLREVQAHNLFATGDVQLRIINSQISESTSHGIQVLERVKLRIEGSRITNHGGCGLAVWSPEAEVTGGENEIQANGLDLCGRVPALFYRPRVPQTALPMISIPDDYATLQEAVDAVAPGGTIALPARSVDSGAVIWKPVRLRGAGPSNSQITGRLSVLEDAGSFEFADVRLTPKPLPPQQPRDALFPDLPALLLYADAQIQNATISGNARGPGMIVGGRAQVRMQEVTIAGNGWIGINVQDQASLEIAGARFFANVVHGLLVEGQAKALVRNATVSNGNGLGAYDTATLEVHDTSVLGTSGVELFDAPTVILRNVRLIGNKDGIRSGSRDRKRQARLVLEEVEIRDSTFLGGIQLHTPAVVTVKASRIISNDFRGITVSDENVQLEISNTQVLDNDGCGIEVIRPARISGANNTIHGNRPDLCGYVPPAIRLPRTPQTERPEVRVPQDYANTQDAIDAVAPGGIVFLPEGERDEALTLWKPMTLRGAGQERTTLKHQAASGTAISVPMGVEGVSIEDLQIAQASGPGMLLYGQAHVVRVTISKAGGCCDGAITAAGGAEVFLEDVTLRDNPHGLSLSEQAHVEVHDSAILENGNGIELENQAQLLLLRTRVEDNKGPGIVVGEELLPLDEPSKGEAIIAESLIANNEESGIVVQGSARLDLQNSELIANGEHGLVIDERAIAHVEGNRFQEHMAGCAISIPSSKAQVSGRDNDVDNNAIPLCHFATASLRRPLVPQTDRRELRVPEDYPALQEAIDALAPGGTITLSPDTLSGRAIVVKPLTIRGQGPLRTRLSSRITGVVGVLIPFGTDGPVRLEGLSLQGDENAIGVLAYRGLEISAVSLEGYGAGLIASPPVSHVLLLEDVAMNTKLFGVTLAGEGEALLKRVTVRSHKEWGIAAVGNLRLTVEDSLLAENSDVALLLSENARGILIRSQVVGNAGSLPAVVVDKQAQLTVSQSRLAENEEAGLWAHDEGQLIVHDSQIVTNGQGTGLGIGVAVSKEAQALIERTTIEGNSWRGISVIETGRVTVRDTTIARNAAEGLFAKDRAQVQVYDSRFIGNEECALWVEMETVRVQGSPNDMRENFMDLCGYAPAALRKPLVSETSLTQIRVPQDYPTLQQALDAIAPGGTLLLAEARFEEGLTIWKPVTLQGSGASQTVLRRGVSIIAQAADVHLRDTSMNFSPKSGLLVYSDTKLENAEVSYNAEGGIVLYGRAAVRLEGTSVEQNGFWGALLLDQARLQADEALLQNNSGYGLLLMDQTFARLYRSRIADNRRTGLQLHDSSEAALQSVELSGNGRASAYPGISLYAGTRLTLLDSQVVESGSHGVELLGSLFSSELARALIEGSRIEGNGTFSRCAQPAMICNGISLDGNAQLTLKNSLVKGNADWGLATAIERCGYPRDSFRGIVEIVGENSFEGNNTSGNFNGQGNPGTHPFQQLPDGQICLPEEELIFLMAAESEQDAVDYSSLPGEVFPLHRIAALIEVKKHLKTLLRAQTPKALRVRDEGKPQEQEILRTAHESRPEALRHLVEPQR